MRTMTTLLTVLGLSLALLMAASGTAPAQSDTSGKVTLESKSVAVGVGVSWGDGVLEYRGKKYPFTVEGLSVLDLGVSKVSARVR
jgi:ABC-type glycerol-3-phosphate transport system substrate-binding protein